MLKKITDLLEDTNCFVCVLIDELSGTSLFVSHFTFCCRIIDEAESLAAAHTVEMNGNEPSGAIGAPNECQQN